VLQSELVKLHACVEQHVRGGRLQSHHAHTSFLISMDSKPEHGTDLENQLCQTGWAEKLGGRESRQKTTTGVQNFKQAYSSLTNKHIWAWIDQWTSDQFHMNQFIPYSIVIRSGIAASPTMPMWKLNSAKQHVTMAVTHFTLSCYKKPWNLQTAVIK